MGEFKLERVRGGEWILGGAGLALLICEFALPWYGVKAELGPTTLQLGYPTSENAWGSLGTLRWLILLVGILAVAIWWLQGTRRAPAMPVAFTVVEVALATLLLLGLLIRETIDKPGSNSYIELKIGAYGGLLLTIAVLVGAYLSFREDGIAAEDGPTSIETLRLAPRPARAR